ncbi:hypothetical protein E4U42_001816 [Claviceps africana]|uniref:Uncharacterized protein n=1 Tax=Claviceps africana TaxID=83212 RepID=A0A8K0JBF9_9HYPO|nr:hypothetical protein E4U42_001816 [Claviceps africana]
MVGDSRIRMPPEDSPIVPECQPSRSETTGLLPEAHVDALGQIARGQIARGQIYRCQMPDARCQTPKHPM